MYLKFCDFWGISRKELVTNHLPECKIAYLVKFDKMSSLLKHTTGQKVCH